MAELLLIVLAAALVNNFVLVQFLGVCPVMGSAQRIEGAIGMALATGFVLTLSAGLTHLVERYVLAPLDLQHLRLISFVVVIGASTAFAEWTMRRFAPLLQRVVGAYVPLIAGNCAVLGVALLNSTASRSLLAALFYGVGAALGFGLALALVTGLRERLRHADVPAPFRGASILFLTAGILSLAFMGFAGFARL
jgi:electron transport complex protein RnfA